jgi:hypothetical protein
LLVLIIIGTKVLVIGRLLTIEKYEARFLLLGITKNYALIERKYVNLHINCDIYTQITNLIPFALIKVIK